MTHRARRQEQKILESAWTLFRAHGFAETTVDEIARGAGISTRTFFRYFPTKDALVFRRAAERLQQFSDALEQSDRCTRSEVLQEAFLRVCKDFDEHKGELLLQGRLINESDALMAREFTLNRAWEEALVKTLRETGPNGEPPIGDERASIVAGTLVGAFRSAIELWLRSEGKQEAASLANQAFQIALRGLREDLEPSGLPLPD